MAGRCDAMIIGSGPAGSALAAHLAAGGWAGRRVLLVDAEPQPAPGRCWGFWAARRTLLDGAVSARWPVLSVHAAGHRLDLPLAPYTYRLVRSTDLRREVDAVTAAAPGFERVTAAVHLVRDGAAGAVVDLAGTIWEADWVFDSRPPPGPRPGEPALWFLGWEVVTPGEVFDPGAAMFMDFRLPGHGHARFGYVLATGPRTALVESACFGTGEQPPHHLAGGLDGYLRDVLGVGSWKVVRQEAGALALRAAPGRAAGERVMSIGARGGMLKPSTGYAFDRCLRDAEAITASLRQHGHPWDVPATRPRHAYLDRVLLDVVTHEPGAIEPAFARMFARNPVARVLRFLDEDTSPADEARLIASLPSRAFLRAAARLARPG